jgi:hypothetical protein
MNTYPISSNNNDQKLQDMKTILQNNDYPPHAYQNIKTKPNTSNKTPNIIPKQKWATFTYIGKETRTITKVFKNINIRIAYKTKNTIQNHLQPKISNIDKYNKRGINKMRCNSCQLSYIGQTGRNFKARYKEHIRSIRINNPNTKYAQHILDTQHEYGPIANIMDILHIERKGQLMNTWERFHIYKLSSRRSLCWYSSLADSGHGVFFFNSAVTNYN